MMDEMTLLADYRALDVLDNVLGRVTHKFSNLISPVLGFSEILMKVNKDQTLSEFIEHTYDYSMELRAFNDFLGASELLPRGSFQSSVEPYADAFLKSYGDALKFLTGAVPRISSGEDLPPLLVHYDAGALEAVMTHIICNALEAGAKAESLEVSCLSVPLTDDLARVLSIKSGDYASFTLFGASAAVSAETLTQAFYPLYTSKDISRHKGMGLWHSYRLMRRMGGTILLFNAPNGRTGVRLLLPLFSGEQEV